MSVEGTNFDGTPLESTPVAAASGDDKLTKEELIELAMGTDKEGKPLMKKFTKAELIKQLGLAASSTERFEQTKAQRAQLESLARAMKDPEKFWEVAKGLGHNVDELLQKKVESILADASLTPEQKQAKLDKVELEKFRKEDAERKKSEDDMRAKQANEHYGKLINDTIVNALKTAKLPDNKANRADVVAILTPLWNAMLEKNPNAKFEDVPMDKVIASLKTNRVGGLKSLIEGADEDSILELLPEDVLEKIAKAITKKYQGSQSRVDDTVTNAPAEPAKPAKRKSFSDLQAETEERVARLEAQRKRGAR